MSIQLSVLARNARLDAIETEAGTAAILKLRTGAQPADCGTADSGTVIISYTLASDWAAAASAGAKAFSNLPLTGTATGANTDTNNFHFRLYKSNGTTCVMQGSAGESGTDLIVDNDSIAIGQTVNVTAFTLTDANA